MRIQCPRCRTAFDAVAGRAATCPECGFEARAPRTHEAHQEFIPVDASEVPVHRPPPRRRRVHVTRERIAIGLAINILVPGLGTLLADRKSEGWGQLVLFLVGLATIPFLVGLALAPAAWVWALVSSIQHLVEYDRTPTPHRH